MPAGRTLLLLYNRCSYPYGTFKESRIGEADVSNRGQDRAVGTPEGK